MFEKEFPVDFKFTSHDDNHNCTYHAVYDNTTDGYNVSWCGSEAGAVKSTYYPATLFKSFFDGYNWRNVEEDKQDPTHLPDIPNAFMFRHYESARLYSAKLWNSEYLITWNVEGFEQHIKFPVENVEQYINHGIWVITKVLEEDSPLAVKEEEQSMESNSTFAVITKEQVAKLGQAKRSVLENLLLDMGVSLIAKTKPTPQIKVGDRVTVNVTEPYYGWGDVDQYSIGTVVRVDVPGSAFNGGTEVIVSFPEQSDWSGVESELKVIKKA